MTERSGWADTLSAKYSSAKPRRRKKLSLSGKTSLINVKSEYLYRKMIVEQRIGVRVSKKCVLLSYRYKHDRSRALSLAGMAVSHNVTYVGEKSLSCRLMKTIQ